MYKLRKMALRISISVFSFCILPSTFLPSSVSWSPLRHLELIMWLRGPLSIPSRAPSAFWSVLDALNIDPRVCVPAFLPTANGSTRLLINLATLTHTYTDTLHFYTHLHTYTLLLLYFTLTHPPPSLECINEDLHPSYCYYVLTMKWVCKVKLCFCLDEIWLCVYMIFVFYCKQVMRVDLHNKSNVNVCGFIILLSNILVFLLFFSNLMYSVCGKTINKL